MAHGPPYTGMPPTSVMRSVRRIEVVPPIILLKFEKTTSGTGATEQPFGNVIETAAAGRAG